MQQLTFRREGKLYSILSLISHRLVTWNIIRHTCYAVNQKEYDDKSFIFVTWRIFLKQGSSRLKKKKKKTENNKVWIPDRCSWAANKSSRWSDFWFKGKLFFHAFKYRWSHICKTLKKSNSGLQKGILSYTSRKCGCSVSDTPTHSYMPKITNLYSPISISFHTC